jgi:uncharacterized protein YjbI with pentapeptide repeats
MIPNKDFSKTVLAGAIFDQIDLSGANFDNATLSNVTFNNVNLNNSTFKYASLNEVHFVNTNLCNVDLSNTKLTNPNLWMVNMEGSIWKFTEFISPRFKKVNVQEAKYPQTSTWIDPDLYDVKINKHLTLRHCITNPFYKYSFGPLF